MKSSATLPPGASHFAALRVDLPDLPQRSITFQCPIISTALWENVPRTHATLFLSSFFERRIEKNRFMAWNGKALGMRTVCDGWLGGTNEVARNVKMVYILSNKKKLKLKIKKSLAASEWSTMLFLNLTSRWKQTSTSLSSVWPDFPQYEINKTWDAGIENRWMNNIPSTNKVIHLLRKCRCVTDVFSKVCTLPVKSLDPLYELNFFFFFFMTIDIAVSHRRHQNYGCTHLESCRPCLASNMPMRATYAI